jgi:hypothetical protein
MGVDPALIGSAPGAQSDDSRAPPARERAHLPGQSTARPDAGIQNRRELIKPPRLQMGR